LHANPAENIKLTLFQIFENNRHRSAATDFEQIIDEFVNFSATDCCISPVRIKNNGAHPNQDRPGLSSRMLAKTENPADLLEIDRVCCSICVRFACYTYPGMVVPELK
jgi:hypothetical protein